MSVVLVGLLINFCSAHLNKILDGSLGRFSKAWRLSRLEKYKKWSKAVVHLSNNPEDEPYYLHMELANRITATTFIAFTIMLLVMAFISEQRTSAPHIVNVVVYVNVDVAVRLIVKLAAFCCLVMSMYLHIKAANISTVIRGARSRRNLEDIV